MIIDGQTLSLESVAAVAYQPQTTVVLSEAAKERVIASRKVIESVLASGQTVYGVNTGFGPMSSYCIDSSQLQELQENLVRSHAAGTGEALSEPVVRAMMLLRANTLAKGVSGVRAELIEAILSLLNRRLYPRIPSQGSLGASGDLAPLAHLALVLIGEGEAFVEGVLVPGKVALERAGLSPLVLAAKEGLALLNGTQMMSAIGVLSVLKAEHLLWTADLAGAMTIEAVKGSHHPFDELVWQVRPHPGHGQSATRIRQFLAQSEIEASHHHCNKVQDAYSLRCIPQVHGAALDAVFNVRQTLAIEINAATDNPLVFPSGEVISQGNFHGEPVAIAMDMLAIAMAEIANISERRMDKLMNPVFSGLPAFLVQPTKEGLHSGFMIAHYTAASLVSENKVLSHPASVDSVPTSNDKEDHVSMGAIAARKAEKIIANTRWVLATELLAACQGLDFHQGVRPGKGVEAAHKLIRKHVPSVTVDRTPPVDIEKIAALIDNGSLQQAVEEGIG